MPAPAKISRPGGETPVRSVSSASTGSQPASIFRANVVTVNTRNYTVDVRLEAYPYANHFDIPWSTPYVHQAQGEGINVMPEVGSVCWVCTPSESGRDSFVIGWITVDEEGSYRGGRELLNPGDIHLSTRDGNFVTVRRGGIVQIGATPVCQRVFIPIRNIIRDFAENYTLSTPGGDMSWEVSRTDDQGDGHRGCLYTLAAKEFADDPNKDPVAVLKIGSHGEGNETILSLVTRDKGGGSSKTDLKISKAGAITWSFKSDATFDITGDYASTIKGKMTTSSDGDMSFATKTKLTAQATTQASVTGGGATVNLAGTASMNGSAVLLGDAVAPAVYDDGSLTSWIMQVTALLSGPPSAIAFKGILQPPIFKSTKVRI